MNKTPGLYHALLRAFDRLERQDQRSVVNFAEWLAKDPAHAGPTRSGRSNDAVRSLTGVKDRPSHTDPELVWQSRSPEGRMYFERWQHWPVREGGVHALLKLGASRGVDGSSPNAMDTLTCLDSLSPSPDNPVYLGTNSQAVSDRLKDLIARLYLLAEEDTEDHDSPQGEESGRYAVRRVLEVEGAISQFELDNLRQMTPGLKLCPGNMSAARTWFRVVKASKVQSGPDLNGIRLLRTGESILRAATAGRATFFYVQPIEGLELD